MSTDDDEDVIIKGSELYLHLINSDYSGPVEFYDSGKVSRENQLPECKNDLMKKFIFTSHLSSWWTKLGFNATNNEEKFSQKILQQIWASSLLLVEDADFIENLIGDKFSLHYSTNQSQKASLLSLFALGTAALTVTFLTTSMLPWKCRIPSLMYAAFTTIRVVDQSIHDWQHDKLHTVVMKFSSTLSKMQTLITGLTKVLQFIQEMELIDRGFTLPNLVSHLSIKTQVDHPSALLCLPLRTEMMEIMRNLHELAKDTTLKIRSLLPLGSALDNPSHYVACNITPVKIFENDGTVSLQSLRIALRQNYIQVSEMFRRLALCFLVPNYRQHLKIIEELNRMLPDQIQLFSEKLELAYKYFAAWKVLDHSSTPTSTDVTSANKSDKHGNLELALHSLERHLRAAALIIDSIPLEENPTDLRNQLSHECKAIGTCWELAEFEFVKSSNLSQIISAPPVQQMALLSRKMESAEKGEVLPLYGPWEPDIQDEILEADLESESVDRYNLSGDENDDFFLLRETREQRLARKRELAAQSKRLYSELQVVLKSKADEWKEREARIMERLGKPVQQEDASENVTEETPTYLKHNTVDTNPKGNECTDQHPSGSSVSAEQPLHPPDAKFDMASVPSSSFSLQASLAAQVRALASQRTVQQEDLIGDSDDAESTSSFHNEDL